MTDNREAKKLNTPSGKEFELKTYLTARERNELRSIYLQAYSADPITKEVKPNQVTGVLLDGVEHKTIELAVLSFNGSADNILSRLLDGTPEDYDFVYQEANKLSNFSQPK